MGVVLMMGSTKSGVLLITRKKAIQKMQVKNAPPTFAAKPRPAETREVEK